MTATKVSLTERPQISIPAGDHAIQGAALFLVAFVFTLALLPMLAAAVSAGPDQLRLRGDFRAHPNLTHFFFLPPPAPTFAS